MSTKTKQVSARVDVRGRGATTSHLTAHQTALEMAIEEWVTKFGEMPPWDNVSFRGGHTTTEVVIEMWEDEA